MKTEIPTLKEVAQKANISIRTVSRVLNDSSLVNKKTKAIVLDAIKELNYKPNLVARSLKCRKSHCIGIVVDDLRSPFYGPIIKEIELIAYKNNYSIFICNSEFDHKIQERHMENLISRAVDGIIILRWKKILDIWKK
jgi:LacI family transcriptional regulator